MKGTKRWAIRLVATVLVLGILFLIVIMNPSLLYSNQSAGATYTIYHNKAFHPTLPLRIAAAQGMISKSELYHPKLKLDVCFHEGSPYPKLLKAFRANAYGWGFFDKVVLLGKANYEDNYVEVNGHKWNLTQLLTHEAAHCYHFDKYGFWGSNPLARIPDWKWEGYPEYLARQNSDQKDLRRNIARLLATQKKATDEWIPFTDGTGTTLSYYNSWLLVQYCMEIKKQTYTQLLADATPEQTVRQQMMDWYRSGQ